ncbi:MAG: TIR domain-containing protein [Myxococcales bacterium]|nr:MAG: TIR domain-containing protein [Myxococcales bacterium]
MKYQAFISYKHGALPLAQRLSVAMRQYAKPLFTLSPRIFRDEDYLVPEGDLPGLIRNALDTSEFLILLASPAAAASEWVREELQHWCTKLGRGDRMIIVLTDGNIEAEANHQMDWVKSNALPSELAPFVTSLPLYIDMRWATQEADFDLANGEFRRAVNMICARLRGVDPNDMAGVEVRQTRRNVLIRNFGMAAVFAFALVAAASAYLAERERNKAEAALQAESAAKQDAEKQKRVAQSSERVAEDARKSAEASERRARTQEARAIEEAENAKQAAADERAARELAQQEAKKAESGRLASESDRAQAQLLPEDLDLAIKAVESIPTPHAVRTLRSALRRPRPVAVIATGDPNLRGASIVPNGRFVLTYGHKLQLWDASSERYFAELQVSADAAALAADERSLLAAQRGAVARFDLGTGTPELLNEGVDQTAVGSTFTSAGYRGFTRDGTGMGHAWGDAGKPLGSISQLPDELKDVAWSDDGAQIALADANKVRIWDWQTGKDEQLEPTLDGAHITAAAIGPAKTLAVGDDAGYLHLQQVTHSANVTERDKASCVSAFGSEDPPIQWTA